MAARRHGGASGGATRKERLMRAKMKKKMQEEENDPNSTVATTFEDILQMSDLSEQSLLDNLRKRYEKDMIYTYVGPILIAINPYKELGSVYGENAMTEYYGKAMGMLPPHVFALADSAYTQLIQGGALDPMNQSIIISGESGAGKTETTKIIMQYLARATSYRGVLQGAAAQTTATTATNNAGVSRALGKLEERVLESNPLLESFGNAKTLRNDNSSRFGKFIEIQFDHHGKIVGAEIMNFLLEKTRIVSQSIGERNYHIFYQLLAGADPALREKLHLKTPEDYEYLRKSQCYKLPTADDAEEFETTKHCMKTIGIDDARQERVFHLLAAVLHLGNLEFAMENETCVAHGEESKEALELIANLLRVSVDALQQALLTRQLYVGGKVIVQQQNVDQVIDKRDALAKAIYSSLFLWLVSELNRTISRPDDKWGFIGVLDIYGFEKFDWNTFEQLCINYANEKLQRHFNQHMLEVEQEEYTKEGIDWKHIDFQDNQACLDLIEGKPMNKPGIFIALDDVWRLKGEEANRKFVAILHASFGRDPSAGANTGKTLHDSYVQPKLDATLRFGIKHYAGEVIYDASGFNDKNNETLNDDMKELIRQSASDWVRLIFDLNVQSIDAIPGNTKRPTDPISRRPAMASPANKIPSPGGQGAAAGNKSRNLREVSVGAQFRFQLQELMSKISLANPRYVRCIKPNEHKRPQELNDPDVARQLKYSGMMEAIQIRQRGFALREDHDVFFYDYQSLAPDAENISELVEEISTMLGAGKDQWQLGKTKVFLKRVVAFKLRKLHTLRCKAAARTLQKWCRNLKATAAITQIQAKFRQYRARKQLLRLRNAAYRVRAYLRMRVDRSKFEVLVQEYRYRCQQATIIQKYARGYIVRNKNLLHPFVGLGPKELDAKIVELEGAIADAAKNKQFELCANLQKDLEKVVEARKMVRTAKEIDAEIDKVNAEMEVAAKSKQFARCAELQKQLEELQEQRRHVKEDLNELEPGELDERIHRVETQIAEAMQARDFEKCGNLQTDLDKLVAIRKTKQTPEEMDVELARLNGEIAMHMKRKEFDKCAAVQREIDMLKKRREKFGPIPTSKPAPAPAPAAAPATRASAAKPTASPATAFAASAASAPVAAAPASAPAAIHGTSPTTRATPTTTVGAANVAAVQPSIVAAKKQPVAAMSPTLQPSAPTTRASFAKASVAAPSVQASVSVAAPKASFEGGRPRSGSNSSVVSSQSYAKSTISVASTMNRFKKKESGADSSSRTVERLRPAKPLTVAEDISVFEAAKLMKSSRAAAVIVVDAEGALAGIFTDTDTARRVVSKGLDPHTTPIGSVMTPQPKCVSSDESAAFALDMMLTGRFRHLPVVSAETGAVTGVLNVAKCLHDAIRRIENSSSQLKQELGNSANNAMLRNMLEKMLSPSLQDVLAAPGETQAPQVHEYESILDVSHKMAEAKKPALVVSEGPRPELIGIFTPKDLLHRVIAADIDLDTPVGNVMTPEPESTTPDTMVLDAFHIMHDGKFLNLPVVSPTSGEVHGIADVLSIAVASFGQGESRDMGKFWNAAFDLHHHDPFDDNASVSGKSTSGQSVASMASRARQRKNRDKDVNIRPVSSLRPTPAVVIGEDVTIVEAATLMSQKRSDALLVVDESGALTGILTDTDICRRVLAVDLDPANVAVAGIMTKNIKFVAPEDSAIDAMLMMQEGHFRHLPVVSRDSGTIVGVLNIGKCIYDVSKRLEHAMQSTEQLKQSLEKSGASSTVQQLLGPMLQKLSSPTLGSILEHEKRSNAAAAPRVRRGTTVKEAVKAMAATRKAALIVDGARLDRLCGIFSPNELVLKVIAKSLNPATTRIEDVMQSDPEIATPSTSVLDALHIMHDSKCLNIPVVVDGSVDEVAGLVDVLALSYGTIETIYGEDREQMQEFWNTALQLDQPTNLSGLQSSRQRTTLQASKKAAGPQDVDRTVAQLRPTRVLTISDAASVTELSRMMGRSQTDCVLVVSSDGMLVGIITDTDLTRRVVSENKPLESTRVGDVMTKNPTFVSTEDQAIDALCKMLEGKFRHLPVVDGTGSVVGILNIGKCLYDAIRKMEKSEQSNASLRHTLEKELKGRGPGGRGGGASNLSVLLGPMMEKIFSPDVKSVIDHEGVEPPRVQPYTSVYEVSKAMAATKKAALVVSNRGQFFGLFTPKDMLENVLAKGLPVHTTPVCEVMSEDAVTIYGNTTVIDAMHSMHENKTLYLGVLQSESSPQAIGLVDVLSLSYGSFAKGNPSDWRAFWNASFDAAQTLDDDDDTSSVHSFRSSFSLMHRSGHEPMQRKTSPATGDSRPVSKLRPTKSVTIREDSTVADAAREMGLTHTDAALVISHDGVLKGILTDTDVTRRVVALGNDPNFINVCDAMTPNPKFVDEKDSAMDAMFMMLEGRFRHLPVVDSQGMVAGMLRIQKCLYDAITRLEKAQQASSGAVREKLEKQLMSSGLGVGLAGNDNAIQQLLAPMVEKLLSPTLETILKDDSMPPLVRPTDTVMEVARQMSSARKAALVVEDAQMMGGMNGRSSLASGKKLIGVFTPKDLLLRVVGAGLDAAMTCVSEVMTPNPEAVSPSTSLVDALHVMDEHKFLHLPVVDEASGSILGMVDVLSLCYGTFAKGAHGGSGGDSNDWKSFWDMSLALARDDDDRSDVGSLHSVSVAGSKTSRRKSHAKSVGRGRSYTGSSAERREAEGALRPVSKLRPRPVTRINEYITVAEAARRMRQSRSEAVVITTDEGELRGILTDTDVTRRVLAKEIDPETCSVSSVMTSNPSCVRMDDPAIEAITKMLEGRFKHLPVVGPDGIIQGMLDISKCLYDAISCMEKVQQSTEAAASEFSRDLGAGSSLQRLLGPMMEKMVRPTVAIALEGEPKPPVVQLSTMVSAAAKMMSSTKKAAVVVEGHDIVGILTPKDLLRKLVAKGLDASTTAVEEVMTSDPESLGPNARILDGLRLMHDAGQLFMPVLTENGDIYGMADVLCLSYGQFSNSSAGSGGGDWRQFWQTAMNLQEEAGGMFDADETASVGTIEEFERSEYRGSIAAPIGRDSMSMRGYSTANAYAELGESASVISAAPTATTSVMFSNVGEDSFVFKVSDKAQGHYHRLMCRYDSISLLFDQVRAKVNAGPEDEIRLKYEDDDGDLAVLSTDESLVEAVNMAKRAGWKRIVLLVDVIKPGGKKGGSDTGSGKKVGARPRKLTKVDEDIESEDEEEEEEEEEEETPKVEVKKPKAKRSSRTAASSTAADSNSLGLIIGGSVVLLGLGIAAMVLLRSKN